MKTYEEMLAMSDGDIERAIQSAEREAFSLLMAISSQQGKNNPQRKKMKKYIARLKTARRQKQIHLSQGL
jgi:ribosomal protein L29